MVLYDHRSIQTLYPYALIPATEKVIKPHPYRIYRQKTGSYFWSANYTRPKIPFLCSGKKLQIFKYQPFERTVCIDTYRINFVYQKTELQGSIAYLWKKRIIMILEHIQIFVRKATPESQRCCNVNTRSEIVTTLSDVVTKIQPKPNVVTTSCASWVPIFRFLAIFSTLHHQFSLILHVMIGGHDVQLFSYNSAVQSMYSCM